MLGHPALWFRGAARHVLMVTCVKWHVTQLSVAWFDTSLSCCSVPPSHPCVLYGGTCSPVFSYCGTMAGGSRCVFVESLSILLSLAKCTFLCTFAKLRKATVLSCLSFRPSAHPHGTVRLPLVGFWLTLICFFFLRKSVEKIQALLKSDKNDGYCTWRRFYIRDSISLNSF
jgi:hypothetical protein